jgi:predicted transcriptional regulator
MSGNIKENVIEMIRRMPDDATVTDIMAELYVRRKIDVGLEQLDKGQTLSQEEVEQRLSQWLS